MILLQSLLQSLLLLNLPHSIGSNVDEEEDYEPLAAAGEQTLKTPIRVS